MCGIVIEAGSRKLVEPNEKTVLRMAETIWHRGPDDGGYFCIAAKDWAVNLAMRRLAVIDVEGGQQPFHAGKVDLILNGEIYNHRRIRHNLNVVGVPFETHSDTEVLARLWDREGPACVSQLGGMFAFAAWDRGSQTLYLVRDRIGKKPLYYYWNEGKNLLVSGSELKAVLAHPHVPREVNPEGIFHFLSLQYVPEPMTAYQDIQCVPAGGMVAYQPAQGKLEVSRWYELKPWEQPPNGLRSDDYVREVVREAILCRLESDVPLGVYLSGGIDSAIVTAVAKEACAELHTFSMGFVEDAYNELPAAKLTAQHFGTIHHEAIVHLPQLPEMTERIVAQYDQPFGDCSAIPTMLLAEESRKYITVALTGDGGDEAFGGYERYTAFHGQGGIAGYIPWLCVIPFAMRDKMLDPLFSRSLAAVPHTRAWMLQQALTCPTPEDLVNAMGWLDTKTYLPNDVVVKMERASMAASVEARCPFLDHRVLELAFALPGSLKIQGQVGKLILKEAFKGDLPLNVILRPKKGFSVPIGEWIRTTEGRQLLAGMVTDLNWPWGILNGGAVAALLEGHLNGTANCGHAVWEILMLHLWMKKNFE